MHHKSQKKMLVAKQMYNILLFNMINVQLLPPIFYYLQSRCLPLRLQGYHIFPAMTALYFVSVSVLLTGRLSPFNYCIYCCCCGCSVEGGLWKYCGHLLSIVMWLRTDTTSPMIRLVCELDHHY